MITKITKMNKPRTRVSVTIVPPTGVRTEENEVLIFTPFIEAVIYIAVVGEEAITVPMVNIDR